MRLLTPTLLLLISVAACQDTPSSPQPAEAPVRASVASPASQREALVRQFARRLADPALRRAVNDAIARSPHAESKVPFDQFLERHPERASAGRRPLHPGLAAQLEMYFPVEAHRRAWDGSAELLIGTIGRDDETPVAFTTEGRRVLLDPVTPPTIPVLSVVPRETDFDGVGAMATSPCSSCGGDIPGLYLTRSHTNSTFESWLKGKPEFEILVLGQDGSTDSMTVQQCLNERGVSPAYFNQDGKDWSGGALVISQPQLDAFRQAHPGQALRLFMVEDDDTPCAIKASAADIGGIITSVDSLVRGLAGGRDVFSTAGRLWKAVPVLQQIVSATASVFKTDDDLVGNAVEDVTTAERYTGYNWIIKGKNGQTNGVLTLEMRGGTGSAGAVAAGLP